LQLTAEHVWEAQRELCRRSFVDFVRLAWPVIEPATPYVHGKHVEVVCSVLEAVARGEIRRLVLNVPPGTMKSTLVGVMLPAWLWGPQGRPGERFVGVAHEQTLGIRDNLKCRRLIGSEWYQRLWGDTVKLTSDQNEKLNFENNATGFRSVATPSNITGRRGSFVLVDDPLSASGANSEAEREKVNLWFQEALPTRMNDPERSAIILVMQRLHERDPTGFIKAQGWDWEHVMLPMRYEPDRASRFDWRTEPGELLFPERFPEHVVAELEKTLGSYASAGQLQQRPAPREGGLFKRAWFPLVGSIPAGRRTRVRAWDFAATEKNATNKPDWTAGVVMSRGSAGDYLIEGCDRFQGSSLTVHRTVRSRAETDGRETVVRLPQDPGQAGKDQAQQYVRELAGFRVKVVRPTGNKAENAEPLAVQAEGGNVSILRTGHADRDAWIEPFLDELCLFPAGAHDDQLDAAAHAFLELASGSTYTLAGW
jgi:predicted phage terminase large subunit-like protein